MKYLTLLLAGLFSIIAFGQNEYQLDTIYNPAKGEAKNVALIYFGGSEGGMPSWDYANDSLPLKGYPTLAVKYHEKREKPHMVRIPLDSIHKLILHFKSRPEIRGKKLVVDGVSKGAELVLLLGSMFKEIDAVTALAPSQVVWEAIDFEKWQDKSTWTYKGKDIPFMPYNREIFENSKSRLDGYLASLKDKDTKDAEIKVENIKGPILLFSGESDDSWPASDMGDKIMERLRENNFPYQFEHHVYPNASHSLSTAPTASGTLEGNKQANEHYYKTHLAFLEQLDMQWFEDDFNRVSQKYQEDYMNARCADLLPMLDENLVMFENGEDWPYEKLKKFCSHLPVKPVISTERSYKILDDNTVYEFVSQKYQIIEGRTFIETQARIWKYNDKIWKIIKFDISRYPIETGE